MPEPISVISSVGSVIGTSVKIGLLFHRISQQYAGSELYMAQATAQCSAVRLALVTLQDSLESRYTLGASPEAREEVLASVEAVTVAFTMSFSILEKYITARVKAADEDGSPKNLGKRQKLKIAWNHDEIGHHLQQLGGCQSSLTLLLGVLHCRSTAKMCSLLAEIRATLERVHLAIQDAGFDGVSLSGMTLQIEEAFEFVQPGKMISDGSGLSRPDEQEARVHGLVDSSEPQGGSQHLLQAQVDDPVDTTPDTQLVVAAKEPRKTEEPQSGTSRPFVVNIFQNFQITGRPAPKEPEPQRMWRLEEWEDDGSWADTSRDLAVIGSQTDRVMSALRPLSKNQEGIRLMYRWNPSRWPSRNDGLRVSVHVISADSDEGCLTDLFLKYIGPDTSGGPSNLDDCQNWRLMKVDKRFYQYPWMDNSSDDFRTSNSVTFNTVYHRAEKSGMLKPLKWRQPISTKSTEGIEDMVMQALGLLLHSDEKETRRAKVGVP